jgi:hypothetical protein
MGKQFCLKGIMSTADAKRAVDIGATAIMVSIETVSSGSAMSVIRPHFGLRSDIAPGPRRVQEETIRYNLSARRYVRLWPTSSIIGFDDRIRLRIHVTSVRPTSTTSRPRRA